MINLPTFNEFINEANSKYPKGYVSFAKESDGEIHEAYGEGRSIKGKSTTSKWSDGAPVTKKFKSGTVNIPEGEFYIIETKSYWYWLDGQKWCAVSRKVHGTPPFEY